MNALATGTARAVVRVHRTALIVWGAFVVAAIGYLVWLNEVTADSVYAKLAPCEHVQGFCDSAFATLEYSEPLGWVSTAMYYSFWAVAAWAAASLIGRELENGTAKLAWTQSVSPARWLAAKLGLPALALVLSGTLFVVVFRWAWSAHRDLMGDDWTFADVFAARGPALVAYGLCALAVGTLTALVLRRPLPALGVSVVVMIALNQYLAYHRDELWPTVTRTSGKQFELSDNVWQVENGTIVGGRRLEGLDYFSCDGSAAEIKRCIDDMGISGYYAAYHPQSHFWPMNLVETGILLTIAALATAASFLVLRSRTARTM